MTDLDWFLNNPTNKRKVTPRIEKSTSRPVETCGTYHLLSQQHRPVVEGRGQPWMIPLQNLLKYLLRPLE